MSFEKRKIHSHVRDCEIVPNCDDVDEVTFELTFR